MGPLLLGFKLQKSVKSIVFISARNPHRQWHLPSPRMNPATHGLSVNDRTLYTGKRLGIMQPYFFPYLGYFGLIAHTDRWIVFDPVQYIRKGWVNRNRVLKQGGGWKYVGLTMAPHHRETLIKDMELAPDIDHLDQLVRHLDHYRNKRAPHYDAVLALLERCFDPAPVKLAPFLHRCLELCCAHIGIPFHAEVYSGMDIQHEPAKEPGDWALNICKALAASSYLNPPGGKEFFTAERFTEAGITLEFYHQELPAYVQRTGTFEPGLSILDVMMFNSPAEIRAMLDQYTVEKA